MVTLQVTLDVASDSKSNVVKLTRERIALKPVSFQMCGPVSDMVGPADASAKLAYVRVATFNKQTTENAKAAFRQLKADGASRYALPGKLQKAVATFHVDAPQPDDIIPDFQVDQVYFVPRMYQAES